jgi:ankyrin repeat protein
MYASQNGHDLCALALIKAGANVEHVNNEQWTSLMWASSNGHDLCALALIKAGANL